MFLETKKFVLWSVPPIHPQQGLTFADDIDPRQQSTRSNLEALVVVAAGAATVLPIISRTKQWLDPRAPSKLF